MLLNIILFSLIGLSFVGLAVIILRKLPALADLSEDEMLILRRKKGIIRKIREIDYKQYWLNFIIFLEKFLLKLKILFIKIENFLGRRIKALRIKSQIMTQKSRQWIKQRELKRRESRGESLNRDEDGVSVRVNQEEDEARFETEEIQAEEDELPLSELKKPIKEEQKWIDLIVENPKNITAYKFLGLLYWRQHNYADAKASLEMAVKLGSKDKKVLEILKELKGMDAKGEN